MARDVTTIIGIDLEIARLWTRYRRIGTSALLPQIDELLEARHALTIVQGEMRHPDDIASISEYGPADTGQAA